MVVWEVGEQQIPPPPHRVEERRDSLVWVCRHLQCGKIREPGEWNGLAFPAAGSASAREREIRAGERERDMVVRCRATRPWRGGSGERKRGNRGRILVPVLAFFNSNSLSEAVPSDLRAGSRWQCVFTYIVVQLLIVDRLMCKHNLTFLCYQYGQVQIVLWLVSEWKWVADADVSELCLSVLTR